MTIKHQFAKGENYPKVTTWIEQKNSPKIAIVKTDFDMNLLQDSQILRVDNEAVPALIEALGGVDPIKFAEFTSVYDFINMGDDFMWALKGTVGEFHTSKELYEKYLLTHHATAQGKG